MIELQVMGWLFMAYFLPVAYAATLIIGTMALIYMLINVIRNTADNNPPEYMREYVITARTKEAEVEMLRKTDISSGTNKDE